MSSWWWLESCVEGGRSHIQSTNLSQAFSDFCIPEPHGLLSPCPRPAAPQSHPPPSEGYEGNLHRLVMLKSYKWKGEELPSLKLRAPPGKMLVGTTILSFLGIQPIFLSCLFLGGTKPAFVGKSWNRLNGWFPQPLQKRFSFSEKRVEFNRILERLKHDPFGLKKCTHLTTYITRTESTNPGLSACCFSSRLGHLTTQPTSPQIARLPQRSPKVWWTYPQVESLMQNGLPKLAKFRRYPTTLGRQKNSGFLLEAKSQQEPKHTKKKGQTEVTLL